MSYLAPIPVQRQKEAALVAADLIEAVGRPGITWCVCDKGVDDLYIQVVAEDDDACRDALRAIPLDTEARFETTTGYHVRIGETDGVRIHAVALLEGLR